jgi:hypothetical protein
MRFPPLLVILVCFAALFLICYAPVFFQDRQFGYRDAAHYYYPLNQRVQEEWNHRRWPLWEPEENSGMPLLGNPTAAVLYPGKLLFACLPYPWAARVYIVVHSALAFLAMLVLMRSWGTSWYGSALSATAYAFGAPILFQYCNIIYLIGAAWLPFGVHAVDRWVRLGRRWAIVELTIVLSMQVLGGDPQAAYLLGLASIAYAIGLAWRRAASIRAQTASATRRPMRLWLFIPWVALGLALWFYGTLYLAQRLPALRLRGTGKPTPPLFWMEWMPRIVLIQSALVGLGFVIYWIRRGWRLERGWRFPLGFMTFGLACSAALSFAVTAAQLVPVIEFTQRTSRAARGGPHEIYPFSVEPYRLVELVWPNFLGVHVEGKNYWGDVLNLPGMRPKEWVPSLYLGGLTLVLAVSSLALRAGPPWRVWLSLIAIVCLLGSLGQYTSPIWLTRVAAELSGSKALAKSLSDLGPIDPVDATPVRQDGYLRDGDGGFYWWLSTFLPGFRQFRFPAKLFTFTALGMAALAGLGWDRLAAGRARGVAPLFLILSIFSAASLLGVVLEREPIVASLGTLKSGSLFGKLEAGAGYQAIQHSLEQAILVFALGFASTMLVRRRPQLAGTAALIVMTVDLAAANARYVLTVPQQLLEGKPEVLNIIEAAERAEPARGPYRVHRMPLWNPCGWPNIPSNDRVLELVTWEHATIQPKYGITLGVEYTHTMGVAELYDYEWYFNGFARKIHDQDFAKSLGVELETEVVYYPRRAYDMWNTRYFIVPSYPHGWRDEMRGYASFVFKSEQIYPEPDRFLGPKGSDEFKRWTEEHDYRIQRNLQEFPRAWVVHSARSTRPVTDLSRDNRSGPMQEILHAGDPIWNDPTQRVYDPRSVAWVSSDDSIALRPFLLGQMTRASERVEVTYPNPQEAVLDVTLASPGIVVLADIYYPGWKLTLDGVSAPIYRVNGSMRGAAVTAGAHRLVFTYAPESFRIGRLISIGGVAALLVLGLACARYPVDPVLGERDELAPSL